MDGTVVEVVTAAIGSAVGAYGRDVLGQVEGAAAQETVQLGQRLLARLCAAHHHAGRFERAIEDVTQHLDAAAHAALRAVIIDAAAADAALARDLHHMVLEAGGRTTASAQRPLAVHHESGALSTGDTATIRR